MRAAAASAPRECALNSNQFAKAQVAIRKFAAAEASAKHTHDSVVVTAMNIVLVTIEAIAGSEAVRFATQQEIAALDNLFLATFFTARASSFGAVTETDIARQQAEWSREQVTQLSDANRAMSAENAKLRNQLRKAREEKSERDELLNAAVIPDPTRPGQFVTLGYLAESGEFRVRCRDCQDLGCTVDGGCGAEVTA